MSVYYDLYQNPPQEGEKDERLHARVLPKGTIPADKFLEIVHNATGFSQAILDGTLQAITDELQRWLADGWIVEVGELGYFSVSLECDRLVQDKKEIRSPSIHFKNVNLRLGSKFRHRFVTMGLERKASPYISHSKLTEEQRLERLLKYLEENVCITRADYSGLAKCSKTQAQVDLNRYIEQGIIRKYGSGRTVVYLKR
ncbi:DNA-binding protein [Bacteroides sp.]|uniref:HU family DNA-binding protein n=1 Tax=Bacteroides sp. TaxID=29523 RepID=UPI00261B8873|nr:DNA-binding protein [Bacteroides sp.]